MSAIDMSATTTKHITVLLQPAPCRLTYRIGSVTYVPCRACGAHVVVGAGHLCPMARRS